MNDLPLLQLFQQLRDRGMLLSIEQYDLLRQSLEQGFGLDWESLERICKLLWVKPSLNYDLDIFEREFKLFQQLHQKAFQEYLAERPPSTSEPTLLGILPTIPPRLRLRQNPDPAISSIPQIPNLDPVIEEGISAVSPPLAAEFQRKDSRFEPTDLPINLEMIRHTWQKLRSPVRDRHQEELDIEATVERISREGIFSDVVMRPRVRKTADLLLLVDESKGLTPYAPVWQSWIQAIEDQLIPMAEIYGFGREVHDAVYDWQNPLQAIPLDAVLGRLHQQRTVVIVLSDLGAATGSHDDQEVLSMQKLLWRLSQATKSIICLNPVPEIFWRGTTAAEIITYLQSLPTTGAMLPFDFCSWSERLPVNDCLPTRFEPIQPTKTPASGGAEKNFDTANLIREQEDQDLGGVTDRLAQQLIDNFETRYGTNAFDFACHAAFPLTITTDLAYCLRQEFCEDADWSEAPILLLSDLCNGVGHDLYEIPLTIRYRLLEELIDRHGENRLDEIAKFMGEYIQYRLVRSHDQSAKLLGYPPQWIALAMLKRGEEVTQLIEAALARHSNTFSRQERFRLVAMMRSQGDLLTKRGLEAITLRQLAQKLKNGELISVPNDFDTLQNQLRQQGFPELKSKLIEYKKLELRQDDVETGDALYDFTFETVRVNDRGEIIQRRNLTAQAFQEPLGEGVNLEMVAIRSGKFMMGSPEDELHRKNSESPQHEVTVQPFFVGKYPITQAQWRIINNLANSKNHLNPNPSRFKGDNLPVDNVSWADASEFCKILSAKTSRNYRLPTEAEWEYACRADTTTTFHFGKTIKGNLANYDSSATYLKEKNILKKIKNRQQTAPGGNFLPNAMGLYNMHGNIWEWCLDHWHYSYDGAPIDGSAWIDFHVGTSDERNSGRILRGGSWVDYPRNCRSASRTNIKPVNRDHCFGFRVVCEIPNTFS
jgi:formylglycine-generating enzyme required for sulfatase activity/uncharacterized protein with von Willebrand factor type A (vWA) domain